MPILFLHCIFAVFLISPKKLRDFYDDVIENRHKKGFGPREAICLDGISHLLWKSAVIPCLMASVITRSGVWTKPLPTLVES